MYIHNSVKSQERARRGTSDKLLIGLNTSRLQSKTINQSSKIDLSELPPCRRSLIPHIQQVNYHAAQWKRSHIHQIELPPPTDHGCTMTDDILEPLWSDGPVLPPSLIDILSTSSSAVDSDSESDMDEPYFENPFSSDDKSDIDI